MTRSLNSLRLCCETLRDLSGKEMEQVGGGAQSLPTICCTAYSYTTCAIRTVLCNTIVAG
ncbi:MAG TPA: hypothetical protein VG245_04515 [Candidatus Dormibacteraeota bacterium]|nr:hypothetical protein [Candidatus Dormibacteraeota bacterium]